MMAARSGVISNGPVKSVRLKFEAGESSRQSGIYWSSFSGFVATSCCNLDASDQIGWRVGVTRQVVPMA
ncbi:MAG: hypothetical protein CMJ81_22070 [Planctomycetaceae bacterium]|nr:hypothetical protein [Planctomycetaceae bacterium]